MKSALRPVPQHTAEEWALAEILRLHAAEARWLKEEARLRGYLKIIAECKSENTAEERYAGRVRYIARRGLEGEGL